MLDEQEFCPKPVILLGTELFYSDGIVQPDRVLALRNSDKLLEVFDFWLLTLNLREETEKADFLERLGLPAERVKVPYELNKDRRRAVLRMVQASLFSVCPSVHRYFRVQHPNALNLPERARTWDKLFRELEAAVDSLNLENLPTRIQHAVES